MHGYLAHAPQLVLDPRLAGRCSASPPTLARAATRRCRSRRSPSVAFVAQEHLERLIHTGHLPFLLTSPVLWLGIALQVPLAVAVWLVARRLAEDIAAPVRAARPAARPRSPAAARAASAAASPSPAAPLHARRAVHPSSPDLVLPPPSRGARRSTQEDSNAQCTRHCDRARAVARVPRRRPPPGRSPSKPVVISITAVNGEPVGGIKRPTVKKGKTVRIVVRTNVGTEVHLHGYNIEKNVKKGVPTVIQFVAKVPGRFELELHPMDALLAQLTVRLITRSSRASWPTGSGGSRTSPFPRGCSTGAAPFVLVVSFIAARRALEDASARRARAGGRDLGATLRQARARAGADRRPGALGRPLRRRPRRGALRHDRLRSATSLRPGSTSSSGSACRLLSVLFGNVWRALSPWRAIADGFVWVWERSSAARPGRSPPIPSASAATRARVALFAFVALELCYSNPSNPRALAFAIALYSYVALFGMLAFGRETWTSAGRGLRDPVRLHRPDRAVRRSREGRIRLRRAAHRPRRRRAGAGLGGVPRRRARLGRVRRLQPHDHLAGPHRARRGARTSSTEPGTGELLVTGVNLLGLARRRSRSCSRAFLAACAIARAMVKAPRSLAPEFVLSLVPIALVYASPTTSRCS